MHNYGFHPDIVRLALVIGIFVSTLIYERWHVTGGAIVVAGYLTLFVNRPLYIVITMVLGVATYLIVQRYISVRSFLYGRRRLVVMVLTGMALQLITGLIAYALTSSNIISQATPWVSGLYGVGFVLPGLIAQDIERQGSKTTLLTLVVVIMFAFIILKNLELIKNFLPPFMISAGFEKTISYSYHIQLIIPAAILSVLVSALLYEWFGLRSGGFVTAAYMALFILQPLHLVFLITVSLLVYYWVTRFLIPYIPIFGRTKFGMMVLTGVIFTWLLEYLIAWITNNTFLPFAGFSIISPMIASLIANDGERQGMNNTLLGMAICTIVVFVIIISLDMLLYR